MASPQGRGRQRDKTQVYAEESVAMEQIAKEAEARLAARRQARYEARNIRMRELEKKAREDEEGSTANTSTTPTTPAVQNHSSSIHSDGANRRGVRETRSF